MFKKKWWTLLTLIFFVVVCYLLFESVSTMNWEKVSDSLKEVSSYSILFGLSFSLINFLILCSYDYLSIRQLKLTQLPWYKVLVTSIICYAFSLNLGALIGGLGFRIRLYSGWGISKTKIPFLAIWSTVTNWSGFILLLGVLLVLRKNYFLGSSLLLLVLIYLLLSIRDQKVNISKLSFKFPSFKFALLQLALSSIQWMSLGMIIFLYLADAKGIEGYENVLLTQFIASVAGVITHIPGGLGVIEAVYLRLLKDISREDLLVALICFRFSYYLLPLALAIPGYIILEIYQKKHRSIQSVSDSAS